MSRLSDVIGMVVEQHMGPNGSLNVHAAIDAAVPMLDQDDVDALVRDALGKRIKDAVSKGVKAAVERVSSRQFALPFDLRPAHALDDEGRSMVLTTELSELQFLRIIEIRRKQVEDDTAYLRKLEDAYQSVRPVWSRHPDWTFGQVYSEYERQAA